MRRLRECPDSSASTEQRETIPVDLYRDTGPKRCQHSQISRDQTPFNLFYTWCNMLLTGLHRSPVVSIPLFLPTNSSILPTPLRARELEAIITITYKKKKNRPSFKNSRSSSRKSTKVNTKERHLVHMVKVGTQWCTGGPQLGPPSCLDTPVSRTAKRLIAHVFFKSWYKKIVHVM